MELTPSLSDLIAHAERGVAQGAPQATPNPAPTNAMPSLADLIAHAESSQAAPYQAPKWADSPDHGDSEANKQAMADSFAQVNDRQFMGGRYVGTPSTALGHIGKGFVNTVNDMWQGGQGVVAMAMPSARRILKATDQLHAQQDVNADAKSGNQQTWMGRVEENLGALPVYVGGAMAGAEAGPIISGLTRVSPALGAGAGAGLSFGVPAAGQQYQSLIAKGINPTTAAWVSGLYGAAMTGLGGLGAGAAKKALGTATEEAVVKKLVSLGTVKTIAKETGKGLGFTTAMGAAGEAADWLASTRHNKAFPDAQVPVTPLSEAAKNLLVSQSVNAPGLLGLVVGLHGAGALDHYAEAWKTKNLDAIERATNAMTDEARAKISATKGTSRADFKDITVPGFDTSKKEDRILLQAVATSPKPEAKAAPDAPVEPTPPTEAPAAPPVNAEGGSGVSAPPPQDVAPSAEKPAPRKVSLGREKKTAPQIEGALREVTMKTLDAGGEVSHEDIIASGIDPVKERLGHAASGNWLRPDVFPEESKQEAPAPTSAPADKQPWEMTKDAYAYSKKQHKDHGPLTKWYSGEQKRLYNQHKRAVEKAVKDGKPVPPEVLREYPSLAIPKGADLRLVSRLDLYPKPNTGSPELDKAVVDSAKTDSEVVMEHIKSSLEQIGKMKTLLKERSMRFQADRKDEVGKALGVSGESLDVGYEQWRAIDDAYRKGDIAAARALWEDARGREDTQKTVGAQAITDVTHEENVTRANKVLGTKLSNEDLGRMAAYSDYLRNIDILKKLPGATPRKLLARIVKPGRLSDSAIQLDEDTRTYVDSKGDPLGVLAKYKDKLAEDKIANLERAAKLSPEAKALADKIIRQHDALWERGVKAGLFSPESKKDWYSARYLRMADSESPFAEGKGFRTTTGRAKQRTFEDIGEAWANGYELRIPGLLEASLKARAEVEAVLSNRQMIQDAQTAGIASPNWRDGWTRVELPGFTTWREITTVPMGTEEIPTELKGKNVFMTDRGKVMERQELWTTPELADALEKVYGESALRKGLILSKIIKANSTIKQMVLMTSLYHHQAFVRSALFAVPGIGNAVRPFYLHKLGMDTIKAFTPEFQELVRAHMTVGQQGDYVQARDAANSLWDRAIKNVPLAPGVYEQMRDFRDAQTDYLFNHLGPGLKVGTGIISYRHELKNRAADIAAGRVTREEIADQVASLSNDNFGGLHLEALGRSKTTQDFLRLLFLAPDWNESNLRSVAGMFQKGMGGEVYRAFWRRAAVRTLGLTLAMSLALSLGDDKNEWQRLQEAWKAGNLRWLDLDITPIYRAVWGGDDRRRYFSLMGHWRDPVRYAHDLSSLVTQEGSPFESIKAKGSMITRTVTEAITGSDYRGQRFTTFGELLGIDDKGRYQTTVKNGPNAHFKGEDKGGKLGGQFTTGGYNPPRMLQGSQVPSFAISTIGSWMPIQGQQLGGMLMGHLDAFDSISHAVGMQEFTGPKERPPKQHNQRKGLGFTLR